MALDPERYTMRAENRELTIMFCDMRNFTRISEQLSPEELTRDFQTADNSVLGTLVHLYFAERLWLARIKGEPVKDDSAAG